jgi:hypothetical protein
MATIIFAWNHPNYAADRDHPRFAGFSEEYATPRETHKNSGFGKADGVGANDIPVTDTPSGQKRPIRINDLTPVPGAAGAGNVEDRLTILRVPDDVAPVDAPAGTALEFGRPAVNRYLRTIDHVANIGTLETDANLQLKFIREIDYPNYQAQTIPPGARGRNVRLIKVDTVFSKEHHNFEYVKIDLGEVIRFDRGYHYGAGSLPQILVLHSDGRSKVESHAFGTIIGPVRDSEIRLGITETKHTPRLGMAWAGMNTGNDVSLAAHGIEGTCVHPDSSVFGHTNGHLLYVTLVLELA